MSDQTYNYVGTVTTGQLYRAVVGETLPAAAAESATRQKTAREAAVLTKLRALQRGDFRDQFSAERLADARADDLDVSACLEACDALATLTSLAGFEALIRGKRVLTFGRPFYAGWGLTEDALTIPRRTARPTLDELVAAALIHHPLYVAPNGLPCEVEDLVAVLEAGSGPAPARRPRALRAVSATLDRRPPPPY
jgi:capsular polysaccharide export protein